MKIDCNKQCEYCPATICEKEEIASMQEQQVI